MVEAYHTQTNMQAEREKQGGFTGWAESGFVEEFVATYTKKSLPAPEIQKFRTECS